MLTETETHSAQRLSAELDRARTNLSTLESRYSSTERSFNHQIAQFQQQSNAQIEELHTNFQHQLSQQEIELRDAVADSVRLRDELESVRSQSKEDRKLIQSLEIEFAEAKRQQSSEIAQFEARNDELQHQLEESHKLCQTLSEQLSQVQRHTHELDTERHRLTVQLASRDSELSAERARCHALEVDLTQLTNESAHLYQRLQQLSQLAEQSQQHASSLESLNSLHRTQISELHAQLAEQEQARAALDLKLSRAVQKNAMLKSDLSRVRELATVLQNVGDVDSLDVTVQ